uniref:DNA2/NAM7 helicase-like C-terminal domain-containing protein n=1 Tax=Meloidogyne incognita TaxID=6306 RepID=A0A914L673_MELIC
MHPLIVEMVSFASYERHGESLEPGRGAEERSLLTTSKFPPPMQNCPIVLLNVLGTCRQDNTSHSLCNDEHSASVIKLIPALYDKISTDISLAVICLYTFQKESLQKEFENLCWNVLVVTVDEFNSKRLVLSY